MPPRSERFFHIFLYFLGGLIAMEATLNLNLMPWQSSIIARICSGLLALLMLAMTVVAIGWPQKFWSGAQRSSRE